MKKMGTAALAAALILLYPPRALAAVGDGIALGGVERAAAYWVLGVCSAVFVLLVGVWSVMLKRSAKKQPAVRVRRKP